MKIVLKRSVISIVMPTIAVILIAVIVGIILSRTSSAPKQSAQSSTAQAAEVASPQEAYKGKAESVADTFDIKVPSGWTASIADTGNFRGIMFARPEKLTSLTYDANASSTVDRNGFPVPNGLTEHFFMLVPTSAQAFDPADHREATQGSFTFDDGTAGTKYYVVKHTDEAKQYGGLLRDNEWQGRAYIYEMNGVRVEAHLALYPSATIDKSFYESVVKTITLK